MCPFLCLFLLHFQKIRQNIHDKNKYNKIYIWVTYQLRFKVVQARHSVVIA